MSAKSEDAIILKLILKGQDEADIIRYLEKHDMVDHISIYRVRSKIREMKAAQAFLPRHPPKKRIRVFAVFLMLIGCLVTYYSLDSPLSTSGRSSPAGYAFLLIVIGFVLFIWPDKGTEQL